MTLRAEQWMSGMTEKCESYEYPWDVENLLEQWVNSGALAFDSFVRTNRSVHLYYRHQHWVPRRDRYACPLWPQGFAIIGKIHGSRSHCGL
jgi:hypothetical protein